MDVTEALRGLRAVRHYSERPVPEEMVRGWLDAARWCGSSRNSQPWRFVVVRERETRDALARLGDHTAHLARAPVVVVLAATEGPFPFATVFDLGRVAQSLQLAAHRDGLGSCVAVFEPAARIERARVILHVPPDMRLDAAIAFGWPTPAPVIDADGPAPSPPGRLPLEALVSWGRYGTSSSGNVKPIRSRSKN